MQKNKKQKASKLTCLSSTYLKEMLDTSNSKIISSLLLIITLSFSTYISAQEGLELNLIDYQETSPAPGRTSMIRAGNKMLFTACDEALGNELWITDGGLENESVLFDINNGPSGSDVFDFYEAGNGTIYFFAWTEETGYELWKSNGSAATTELVKDLYPGDEGSRYFDHSYYVPNSNFLGTYDGQIYFVASIPNFGFQLWTSGGEESNTIPLSSTESLYPSSFSVNSIGAYFTIRDDDSNYQLYRTDGTEAGTYILQSDVSSNFAVHNDNLYFESTDPIHGDELWISDGTLGGTYMLIDITTDGSTNISSGMASLDNNLIFGANGDLWKTDGTEGGTSLILEDVVFGSYDEVANVGSFLLFEDSNELWVSDGTTSGTQLLLDPSSGNPLTNLTFGTSVNGSLFFLANDGIYGAELWVTNGISSGTSMVKDLNPGPSGSSVRDWYQANNRAFFKTSADELYTTNGTTNGTKLISSVGGESISNVLLVEEMNGYLIFYGNIGDRGYQLIRTNGTNNGTGRISDLPRLETGVLSDEEFVDFNGYTYFSRTNIVEDTSYIFKMTESNIIKVKSLYSPGITRISLLGVTNNKLIYRFYDSNESNDSEIYALNPDDSETLLIDGISYGEEAVVSAQGIYFVDNLNLYKTNGTILGTELIDLPEHDRGPYTLQLIGNKIYFSLETEETGKELYVSDGTSSGTNLVKDIQAGPESGYGFGTPIGTVNNKYLFKADDGTNGYELWISDGSLTGTTLLKDIAPGGENSNPYSRNLEHNKLENNIFFLADESGNGRELWKSNGTATGTKKIHDLGGGSNSQVRFLGAFKNEMYLSTQGSNSQIYKTDGTTAGTVMINEFSVNYAAEPIIEHNLMIIPGKKGTMEFLFATDGTGPFSIVDTLNNSGVSIRNSISHNGVVNKFISYSSAKNGAQFYNLISNCASLLELTQDISTSSNHYAQSIIANVSITNEASVLFSANMGVELSSGFSIENLSQLEILIEGCTP